MQFIEIFKMKVKKPSRLSSVNNLEERKEELSLDLKLIFT